MAETLLKTVVTEYSAGDIANWVEEEEQTALDKLSDAISLFGIGVVITIACSHMGKDIKTTAGVVSGVLSGIWAAADVLSAATEALLEYGLQQRINRLGDGDTLRVTTKFYEYTSGSGNSWTRYAKVTYAVG